MIKLERFKGMDNRHKSNALPDGFLRNLVNIDVDDEGKLSLRQGSTLLYSGDVHSLYKRYFVEGGDLKILNSDSSATTLDAGVGDAKMAYAVIGSKIYFSNGIVTGILENESVSRWGVTRPVIQPHATLVTSGDLFEGTYHYAITWIDYNGEESGAIKSESIEVASGGGIQLTQFIKPPVNIEKIAVYVSQSNSEQLYLYGEYSRTLANITIEKHISDIVLKTQFGNKPLPTDVLTAHDGYIYMADGNLLRRTSDVNYGLVMPNAYWPFDTEIQIIASIPNALYIITKTNTYIISTIGGELFPKKDPVKPYGGTKGTLSYDKTTQAAAWYSDRGYVVADTEGVHELAYDNVASSKFERGATDIVEIDGAKKIVGSLQEGTVSGLIDSQFKADEIARKGNAL